MGKIIPSHLRLTGLQPSVGPPDRTIGLRAAVRQKPLSRRSLGVRAGRRCRQPTGLQKTSRPPSDRIGLPSHRFHRPRRGSPLLYHTPQKINTPLQIFLRLSQRC
ncbi:MAG: hypothetical protein HSCHL_1871 [Hydrogenibacillus schlegelii]|uniref:Uncharacterized protein n=1 Tax=Hydrogenibacillus schlegelii TaxID=1484 RepID=A0A2T5GFG4_HYDSH|nr:MAG: hypothetical protein HSCHL_1871 [Hydrogenibacillus schlegelii]